MKKTFLIILFFCSLQGFGQIITQMPEIDDQTSGETDITKVELREDYTVIHFKYQSSSRKNYNFQFPFPNRKQESTTTISINPRSYLNGNSKRFNYIKSTGIPELPENMPVNGGEVYRFVVYYERLDPGIQVFNLIEGKNSPEQTLQFWNFYGVHITNPAKKIPTPSTGVVSLTVKGILYDAQTKKPLAGKVVYQYTNPAKKSGSVIVPQTGVYSLSLSPDAYTITASANGYESSKESLDFSKISRNQQFTQNIYLNPIPQKIEPKKEEAKVEVPTPELPKVETPKEEETAPVKVEENKFRLDKVYFSTGESGLLPSSYEQLDGLLKMLKDSPKMTIIIEGHTDNIGDPVQNKRLSLERAFNVREYLIGKGIAGNRIQFKGYGDTKPISSNDTEAGKKNNRRVEFVIVNP